MAIFILKWLIDRFQFKKIFPTQRSKILRFDCLNNEIEIYSRCAYLFIFQKLNYIFLNFQHKTKFKKKEGKNRGLVGWYLQRRDKIYDALNRNPL